MDKTLHFNLTHITLADKRNKEAAFIDNEIHLTHSLQTTNTENQCKYKDMSLLREETLTAVGYCHYLSATGVVPDLLKHSNTRFSLPPRVMFQAQSHTIHLFHRHKIPQ
jgi:hypothetical protein